MFQKWGLVMRSPSTPAALLVGVFLAWPVHSQQPVFRSAVDIATIDVSVLYKNGRPVPGLGVDDFRVTVDGRPRRVLSSQFIRYGSALTVGSAAAHAGEPVTGAALAAAMVPTDADPARAPEPSRTILIAVDRDTLVSGNERQTMAALARFVSQLGPRDRVGIATLPDAPSLIEFTADHGKVREALPLIWGSADDRDAMVHVGVAEALEIDRGDTETAGLVVLRECSIGANVGDPNCPERVTAEARRVTTVARAHARQLVAGLASCARGLQTRLGPKILLLVSGGFATDEMVDAMKDVDRAFAAADVRFYALQVPEHYAEASREVLSTTFRDDQNVLARGLDSLAGTAGGATFRVVGAADMALERIGAELTGSYLLGVEMVPADYDGKAHQIRVEVVQRGLTVRARREFRVAPRPANASAESSGPAEPSGPTPPTAASRAALGDLLDRAAAYGERFESAFPVVVVREDMLQRVSTAGRASVSRRLRSDLFLVKTPAGEEWLALRDVIAIDNSVLPAHNGRAALLFLERAHVDMSQARQMSRESARDQDGAAAARGITVPHLPLSLLREDVRSRFRFGDSGGETIDGIVTRRVDFATVASAPSLGSLPGAVPMQGRLWIDAADGSLVRSLLRTVSGGVEHQVTVTYCRPQDGLRVPCQAQERHRSTTEDVIVETSYSGFRRHTDPPVR